MRERDVDSRAYAYAYLLRTTGDLPADFPVDREFTLGLFLPQEQAGRFGRPRYPARILLLERNELWLYVHPSLGEAEIAAPLSGVLVMETEKFLLDCNVKFVLWDREYDVPYSARDEDRVSEFIFVVKQRILKPATLTVFVDAAKFGDSLTLAFANFERQELLVGEVVIAGLFIAPKKQLVKGLFRDTATWQPAEYIALTNRRLLWMTDRFEGFRHEYGVHCRYCGIRRVRELALRDTELVVGIGTQSWKIEVGSAYREPAEQFAKFAHGVLMKFAEPDAHGDG